MSNLPDNIKREEFKLPSGAQIEFRQILLREENLIVSRARSKKSDPEKTLSDILTRCCTQITDPGPYPFLEAGGSPDWEKMLAGDRFVSMIDLRCLSYKEGNLYDVDMRCPSCNAKLTTVVNLEEDLTIKALSDDAKQRIANGQPFEVMVAGRKVTFHLPTGATKSRIDKLVTQNPGRDMAASLRSRIEDVEGIERRDILDWLDGNNGLSKEFSGLTSDDAEDLRDAFDEVDGGVDTQLEAQCTAISCGHLFTYDLPFSQIFLPARKISQRKRELRRGRVSLEH